MKLITLLPFMDNEEIKDLAYQILDGEVEGIKLVVLFPFLASADLDEIVDVLIERKKEKSLMTALPFISSAKVAEIHEKIKSGELTGLNEHALLPFLGKDTIKSMVKDIIAKAKKEAKESKPAKPAKDDVEVEVEIDEEDFEDEE